MLKRLILLVTLVLLWSTPATAHGIRWLRAPTVITVVGGDNLQAAINTAIPGDVIQLQAAATWDGSFILPNAGSTAGNPITIRSSNHTLLPTTGHVNPADAANMPRIRTIGVSAGAAFIAAVGANGWVLDGLHITDDAGTGNVNMLVDFSAGNNGMTMTRCYLHQKETGTTYTRSVIRAMIFNGDGLTYTRNYIEDFIGYPYGGTTEPHNSAAFITVFGKNITVEDNYISTWYVGFFLGGSDTSPTQTATLTSASTTSATFSNVTGLAVGDFIRFGVPGTATLSNAGNTPTLTRLTGEAWVTTDGNTNGNWGDSMFLTSVADPTKFGITRLMTLTGDDVFTTTLANSTVSAIPNGTVDYILFQTAKVTNIAGSVITYDPEGTTAGIPYNTNSLHHTPTTAAWAPGDTGRIVDVTVRHNTFHVNPVFAAHLQGIGRGCPKGAFEIKNVDRFLFEGNYVRGYPAVMAFTTANQNGGAPWITNDHITIRSNWIAPDTGFPACSRSAILISDDAYLNTMTPTTSVTITNNLVIGGIRLLLDAKGANVWSITHNTILNEQSTDFAVNALLNAQDIALPALTFTDNIGHVVCGGLQGYPSLYISPVISNNVLIDSAPGCSGGINTNTFGTASAISPIASSTADVGFTSVVGQVYSLALSSTYKGDGTLGSDPGVNWPLLLSDLGAQSTHSAVKGKVVVRNKVVIR